MEMVKYRGPQGGASIGFEGVSYATDAEGCIVAPAHAVGTLSAHGFKPCEPDPVETAPQVDDELSGLKRMELFKVLREAKIPFAMTLTNDELRTLCRKHGDDVRRSTIESILRARA